MDVVVPLRDTPPLTDIAAHLRLLADRIEKGEDGEVSTVLVIVPPIDGNLWPVIYCYGDHMGDAANVGVMELAKTFLINNRTERVV